MGFLQGILAGIVKDLLKEFVSYVMKWFGKKQRIDKAKKVITEERKEVNAAVKDIVDTKARGEELSADQVKRLKAANRKLSSGFFG